MFQRTQQLITIITNKSISPSITTRNNKDMRTSCKTTTTTCNNRISSGLSSANNNSGHPCTFATSNGYQELAMVIRYSTINFIHSPQFMIIDLMLEIHYLIEVKFSPRLPPQLPRQRKTIVQRKFQVYPVQQQPYHKSRFNLRWSRMKKRIFKLYQDLERIQHWESEINSSRSKYSQHSKRSLIYSIHNHLKQQFLPSPCNVQTRDTRYVK